MMETISSRLTTTTISTVLALAVLLPAGVLLTRSLGRRMGDYRRGRLTEVDGILRTLARTMDGHFQEGPPLMHHPLLGDLHQYGVTRLVRGPLAVEVSVSYPADDLRDDRTTVRIRRPPDRRWRVDGLHLRRRAAATTGTATVDDEVARSFEIVGARPLPGPARAALLRVAPHAFSLELREDWIEMIARSDGDTVYVSDVARLRSLVEQLIETSDQLLTPPPGA